VRSSIGAETVNNLIDAFRALCTASDERGSSKIASLVAG
jgi:hypothetical protein